MLTGYLALHKTNLWVPFEFEDEELTVTTVNSMPLDSVNNVPTMKIDFTKKHILGRVSITNQIVVFLVNSIPFEDNCRNPYSFAETRQVLIYAYFLVEAFDHGFTGLSIHCDELDCFYDSSNSYDSCYDTEGNLRLHTKDAADIVKHFCFHRDGVIINGSLHTDLSIQYKKPTPWCFSTRLFLSFPETYNIDCIFALIEIVRKFICLMARRTNIKLDAIVLMQKYIHPIDNLEYNKNVEFFIEKQNHIENEDVVELEKTLPYTLIKEHLSELFQFIADNKLYVRHLRESSHASFTIARMILITAGFEWNANQFLQQPSSGQKECVKNEIIKCIHSLMQHCSSKKKRYYKSFEEMINRYDLSLSAKIQSALNKYKKILLPHIQYLYEINQISLSDNYTEAIGDRIQSHRNAFAHGDISKEIDHDVILDYIIVEMAIACIVFEVIGYNEKEIDKIVKYLQNGNIHTAGALGDT